MNQPKKKILYIITKSNMGGAQRYVLDLATHLPRDKFEVVVAFGGSGALKDALEEKEVRTYTIESFERDINLAKEFVSWRELWQLIKTEKPDIVHLNSSKAGGSGALVARLLGVEHIVFTAHGWPFFEKRDPLKRALMWFFSYLTTLLAHRVIVVSDFDNAHAGMPLLEHKIITIHNALFKPSFFEREVAGGGPPRHQDDLWVVSTGEHTANKNLFMLVDAVRTYNSTNERRLFLTLMGVGENTEALRAYVQKYELSSQIAFTGFIRGASQYLKAFDVFVLPSRKEGLPYGLIEAGAAERACIASNVGGIPEIIDHERTGILVNPSATKYLVNALALLARNPTHISMYGTALKQKIDSAFSSQKMLSDTLAVYLNIE